MVTAPLSWLGLGLGLGLGLRLGLRLGLGLGLGLGFSQASQTALFVSTTLCWRWCTVVWGRGCKRHGTLRENTLSRPHMVYREHTFHTCLSEQAQRGGRNRGTGRPHDRGLTIALPSRPPRPRAACLCGKQGGSDLGQLALRRPLPVQDRASGCPELRPASANQPLGPRWPAISALVST